MGPELVDKWGWWHVSCSYKKGEVVTLTVANGDKTFSKTSDVKGKVAFPVVPMDGYLGANGGYELPAKNFMFKDLRLWASYIP